MREGGRKSTGWLKSYPKRRERREEGRRRSTGMLKGASSESEMREGGKSEIERGRGREEEGKLNGMLS